MNKLEIHKMKLHETAEIETKPFVNTIRVDENDLIKIRIVKVPGGWVYLFKEDTQIKPLFVPYNKEHKKITFFGFSLSSIFNS